MEARVDSPLARLVRLAKHLRHPQGPKDFIVPFGRHFFQRRIPTSPADTMWFLGYPAGLHEDVVLGYPARANLRRPLSCRAGWARNISGRCWLRRCTWRLVTGGGFFPFRPVLKGHQKETNHLSFGKSASVATLMV